MELHVIKNDVKYRWIKANAPRKFQIIYHMII